MEPQNLWEIFARINGALDMRRFIDYLDYHPDRAIKTQGVWRLLCPLHADTVFRTLVLNPRRNTAHCEHGPCRGHLPMNLLELASAAHNAPIERVALDLLNLFGDDDLKVTLEERRILENATILGRRARAAEAVSKG